MSNKYRMHSKYTEGPFLLFTTISLCNTQLFTIFHSPTLQYILIYIPETIFVRKNCNVIHTYTLVCVSQLFCLL